MAEQEKLLDNIEPPAVEQPSDLEPQSAAAVIAPTSDRDDQPPSYENAQHDPTFPSTMQRPGAYPPHMAPFPSRNETIQRTPPYYPPGSSTVVVQQPSMRTRHVMMPYNAVNDYYCLSIITLLCFCWPIGLAALSSSRSVRDRLLLGDFDGARQASSQALKLNIAGIATGAVLICAITGIYFGMFS